MSERVWPDGCPKKSACARHSACMYGCATHKDRPPGEVASEINAETERREGIKIDPADRLNHMAREIAADSFLVDAIGRWTKQVIAEVSAYEKEKRASAVCAAYLAGQQDMQRRAVEVAREKFADTYPVTWGAAGDEIASAISSLTIQEREG